MPVIAEEDEGSEMPAPDFNNLLDLPDDTFAGVNDAFLGSNVATEPLHSTCPSHPESHACLCNGVTGDWDLPEQATENFVGLEEPDYGKFENWIPQFIRPEKPCDYCRMRRLNCYITRGDAACTPCLSLFRECSLTTHTLSAANQVNGYLLDTLHVVDEDAAKEQGTVTGIKPMKSKSRATGSLTSSRLDDAAGSSKRNGIRFPRHAVKILRDWLDAHIDNPYPTEDEKTELEQRTELKPSQINNWLANARRRRKVTEKARPKVCSSPSLNPSTPAIPIPPAAEKPWDELNPFERWKHSPPENEPASITDIANAVAHTEFVEDDQVSTSPSSAGKRRKRSSNGSGFSQAKAPSTTSFETGQSSSKSASTSAAYSHHSSHSHGSFGSFNSSLAGKRDRRRRRKPTQAAAAKKPGDEKKRIFQCTFCTDTFKSKYDWTRHEKSLHLSLEKWICAPLGPVITDPATGNRRCVYCDAQDPSDDHIETHNYRQCEDKGLDARTFYRKDHLRQHLRLMHNCEMTPFMDNWKSVAVNINSRCGFCAKRFTVWQERVDHLTAHFKAGARMAEWKGCRGLDPAVAAQVTNAMPPYLIGIEAVSPVPFSASNKASWDQIPSGEEPDFLGDHSVGPDQLGNHPRNNGNNDEIGLSSKATCWEILTVRMGKFANKMAKEGVILTDEMLQAQARRILYDSDDTWNQTAADNPEWLDLFKKAHGLDFIPNQIGGQGAEVPYDLETYGDLGLRIPFAVQLKAYNDKLNDEVCNCDLITTQHTKSMHVPNDPEQMRSLYHVLAREGVLHDSKGKCKHTECDTNVLEFNYMDSTNAPKTRYRWCTYELPPKKAKQVATLTNSGAGMKSLQNGEPFTATETGQNDPDTTITPKKTYLPRHRYELPQDRAQRFATTTGAWEDSGMMPMPVSTSTADVEQNNTTTGAMMEFLGGDVGHSLPFSSDVATSTIQMPPTLDWSMPADPSQEAAVNFDIERLIAETTESQSQHNLTADAFTISTTEMDLPNDLAMEDLNFDDIIFDMPMDDSFGETQ